MASTTYEQKKKAIEEKYQQKVEAGKKQYEENAKKIEKKDDGVKVIGQLMFGGFLVLKPMVIIALIICLAVAVNFGFPALVALLVVYVAVGILLILVGKSREKKKANEGIKGERAVRQRNESLAKSEYKKELQQLDDWYRNYQEGVNRLAHQYAGRQVASDFSEVVFVNMVRFVGQQQQDVTRKLVDTAFPYCIRKDRMEMMNGAVITFESRRINELQDDMQCEALAEAIAILAKGKLAHKFPAAQVQIVHDDATVTIQLTDVNPNYVPKINV